MSIHRPSRELLGTALGNLKAGNLPLAESLLRDALGAANHERNRRLAGKCLLAISRVQHLAATDWQPRRPVKLWRTVGAVVAAFVLSGFGPVVAAEPRFSLVLLVNLPSGQQAETVIAAGLPSAECVPMMRAIWQANEAAPAVGLDDTGPIPAFDAYCKPEPQPARPAPRA